MAEGPVEGSTPALANRDGSTTERPAVLAERLRTFVKEGELHEEASALLEDEMVLRVANEREPTLLQLATVNGRVAVVEKLLARRFIRADAVCRAKRQTAAHIAAEWGYNEVLALLLPRMPRVDMPDRLGHTPLMVAAANNEVALVGVLVRAGASLSYKDAQGNQALHLAALNGHHAVIGALCHVGASPLATNNKGDTALDIIQRQERFYAGQQLNHPALERCASVQAWQRLCLSQLPRRLLPSATILRHVGEHLEALQLDMFLSGRVVLPVTQRAGDAGTFFGEMDRLAACRRHTVTRVLDDLGDSELSAEEEERRVATRLEDAAIEASLREFSTTIKLERADRTTAQNVEAEYRAQQARHQRRLARKRAADRAFIVASESEGDGDINDLLQEDALDRAERMLREGRRRSHSASAASTASDSRQKATKRKRRSLPRARACAILSSSGSEDDSDR